MLEYLSFELRRSRFEVTQLLFKVLGGFFNEKKVVYFDLTSEYLWGRLQIVLNAIRLWQNQHNFYLNNPTNNLGKYISIQFYQVIMDYKYTALYKNPLNSLYPITMITIT